MIKTNRVKNSNKCSVIKFIRKINTNDHWFHCLNGISTIIWFVTFLASESRVSQFDGVHQDGDACAGIQKVNTSHIAS